MKIVFKQHMLHFIDCLFNPWNDVIYSLVVMLKSFANDKIQLFLDVGDTLE